MWLKKSFAFLSVIALTFFMSACSDDSSSGPNGGEESSSSASDSDEENSSGKEQGDKENKPEEYAEGVTYVTVTEIMYNAPDNSPLEWVELSIVSGDDIKDMKFNGLRLDGAITYNFPAEPLEKDEYIVVTNDPELFKTTYPEFKGRLFGPWDDDLKTGTLAKLSNDGDVIDVKLRGKGDMSCSYSKEPPWSSLADGNGHSLVFIGGNAALASSWAASKKVGGNPGAADEYIKPTKVRLNEIQPTKTASDRGWVELYNAGKEDVDVTGWIFESRYSGKSWSLASGVVPAKGYLVLQASDESVFGEKILLNPKGGEYYLYEVVSGKKTGAETSLMLGATQMTSGVVEVSDGSIAQGALASATEGKANSGLKMGPLFINEIYYHPPEDDKSAIPFEFMELVNRADSSVNLYVTKNGKSKGWKVEGINMEFSSGTIVPAGGLVLLLPDSLSGKETSIRSLYEIKENVIIGFYKGKLSNRGELIAVKEPADNDDFTDASDPTALVQWYYDWSDAALYSDSWDGLEDADGFGKSLQRDKFDVMGYEAGAWKAAAPTIGK